MLHSPAHRAEHYQELRESASACHERTLSDAFLGDAEDTVWVQALHRYCERARCLSTMSLSWNASNENTNVAYGKMCFCVQILWVFMEVVWLDTQCVRSPLNCWSSARLLRLIGQQLAIIFCVWSEGFSDCFTLHCVSLSLFLPFQPL